MNPKIHRLLGLALLMNMGCLLQARAESDQPEEVVITSSRIPLPVHQLGLSVSILDESQIEAHGNIALLDVLRQLPAMSSTGSGGAGKATSLRIRGEEGFRTLTLLDGIRLSDPSGVQVGPQLEHLLSSGVGRVEVMRGPQGFSYGADAGGIVNITSPQSDAAFRTSLDVQTGRYGTEQFSGAVGGSQSWGDYFLSLSDYSTRGFNATRSDTVLQDDDGYKNTTVHGKVGFDITEKLRLQVVHRDVAGKTGFDSCFLATIENECVGSFDSQATRVAIDYKGDNFSHSLAYAMTDTRRENFTLGISSFVADGTLKRLEYVGTATALPGFDLVFGADLEEAGNNGSTRDNSGTYLEFLSDFSENLFITAGARYDDNDDFGSNLSYRLSGAYLIDLDRDATLKFKSSYGTGFRAPSPFEISFNAGPSAFAPSSLISLKQEKSSGYEVGLEYTLGSGLHLEAVYFDQQVEDAIFFDLVNFSGFLQDFGSSHSKGVELSSRVPLGEHWQLSANYTHNDTERPNGLPRQRRPENMANLGLSYAGWQDRLNISAFYRLSRASYDEDSFGALVRLDDFEVLDMNLAYRFTDYLQVYGRVENLTGENYQEIIGFNTPGRAAYVGFRLRFSSL
ncbi:MAG: TonB-dependent receptor [Pseudomonadales bacterium]|nr:TonB-dependent receptor [Pseudomonadales bacterium]